MQIIKMIENATKITKSYQAGSGNFCGVTVYRVGTDLELEYLHNSAGFVRGNLNGQEFIIPDEHREVIYDLVHDRRKKLENETEANLF